MNTSSGRLNFEFGFRGSAADARREPEEPRRILVLADFGGRANRSLREPLGTRRLAKVDTDNIETVFAGFGAALNLPGCGLKFESLDDFHPDQLLKRVPGLANLLAPLRQLQTPSTVDQGAQSLEQLLGAEAAAPAVGNPAPVTTAPSESTDDTLTRLLGAAPRQSSPPAASRGSGLDMQSMIKNIVDGKDITPAATARQMGLRSAAELQLSQRLRSVLHHPDFQALEASWRGLDFLVRRCPDEEQIKYSVLDVTLDELASDPAGLVRLLRDQPPDILVGAFTFGAHRSDMDTLAALAKLCGTLGTGFLGGAHPQLVGNDSFGAHADPDDWKFPAPPDVRDAWQTLRSGPEGAHIGLALPRFILRQPYGADNDPVDGFPFEELANAGEHEAFLWGNSAFLCAQRLAEAWAGGEDDCTAGEVGELPVFSYEEDGESAMKPCAEAWLSDRAAEAIQRAGLIPCLSIKHRDAVQIFGHGH